MVCHMILSLQLISLHLVKNSDCFINVNSKVSDLQNGEADHNYLDPLVKVSKLPKDILLKPSIICFNDTERSLKTFDEVKENCNQHLGSIEQGSFYFEIEPEIQEGNETWTKTEKINSRQKRVKRKIAKEVLLTPKGLFGCFGCVTGDNDVIFETIVKIGNETEECKDKNCATRQKPNILLDIILAGVVAFLFCVLLLGILTCHPVILNGHYIPLGKFQCKGRSENLLKVRYRNQTMVENDFSIVDFE